MKLKNSTVWSDQFLRRMVAWCCREIGMQQRICRLGVFRNSRSAWGGAARYWMRQITVCVGESSHFPADAGTHEKGEKFADRVECLVAVAAHELYHLAARYSPQHQQKTRRGDVEFSSSERATCREELRLLRLFRANRDALLAEWNQPAPAKEQKTIKERRALKAASALAQWQRKAKLAATKIKKYRRQVRYYEQALAAKRSN